MAITLCVCSTRFVTPMLGRLRPKIEMVASAPSTTSTRRMKIRNSSRAVQHPKKPQKMRRAKASRNVSWIKARVAFIAPGSSRLHGPDENVLEGAARAPERFDFALVGAQQIDRLVGFFPRREQQLQRTI